MAAPNPPKPSGKSRDAIRPLASNRRALHEYHVLDSLEAGIRLQGTEVKAVREGRVQLKDSYVDFKDGQAWLVGAHISAYSHGNRENHDPEQMRSMVLTNVLGAAYTIRATMPQLREHAGHLVLTSSIAGRRPLSGSLYSATKFAVTAMGEAARQDLNGTGCRVTLIEPGMVDTPFFEHGVGLDDPLRADDVARAVVYAITQPPHVDVNEIMLRPTAQDS